MMLGATHFWMMRKGFSFVEGGWAMPFTWSIMLVVQALLGDGALAVKSPGASVGTSAQRSGGIRTPC